jgi:Kef-type K+ transport system membrane component KefB
MTGHNPFTLPVTDPVLIFAIVLSAIMAIPVLFRRTNIPPIVGMIIFGIIIGPHALHVLNEGQVMELFGKVGLLYIMFLAGLEIEFVEFRKNSKASIIFGLLSFSVPFALGYGASYYLLEFDFVAASLVGILLASNTLIAFPLIGSLGLSKTSAVTTAVSGTVIADTLVLIILAFLTTMLNGDGEGGFITFLISFSVFTFVIFFLLPKLSSWFFRNVTLDGTTQYLFVFTMLFVSAFAAELAGAEPIIGAFFAGLALNRLIPHSSTLMNRIDFVGNSLFIPFFLISVGMLIRLDILWMGYLPLVYAVALIILAIAGKWIAAYITKLLFKHTTNEMQTIFGLSSARAAATLAVALIGMRYGVISDDLFNATIFLIMVSSLFSSWHTQRYGKLLAIEEKQKEPEETTTLSQRILVPIANPATVKKLIDLAIMIHNPKSADPIYSLAVVKDDKDARKHLAAIQPILEEVKSHAAASGVRVEGFNRLDANIPEAIVKTTLELNASTLILGWSGRDADLSRIFGYMFEAILKATYNQVIISNLPKPLETTTQITVLVPPNASLEYGFKPWVNTLVMLSKEMTAPLMFYANERDYPAIKQQFKFYGIQLKDQNNGYNTDDFLAQHQQTKQKLFVLINARQNSLSYNLHHWNLTYKIPQLLPDQNVLMIYPKQSDLMIPAP